MPDEVIDRVHLMGQNNCENIIITDRNNVLLPDDSDTEEDSSVESSDDDSSVGTNTHDVESTGVDTPDDTDDRLENTGVDNDETDEIEIVFEPDNESESERDNESESERDNESESERENEDGIVENHDDEDSDDADEDVTRSRVSGRAIRPPAWTGFENAYTNLTYKGQKIPINTLRGNADAGKIFEHHQKENTRYKYQYFQGLFDSGDPIDEDKLQVITDGCEQYNFERAMSFLSGASQRCTDRVSQYLMTQYGLKKGLKVFGKDGEAATEKEMKQMLSREVFEEIEYDTLSNEDKRYALPILLFLTRKRDGSVKGRACADGRKQRIWMNKEDTRSPTVATEALFYLLMIDAYEERKVATLDLPGHFLQTPMDERLILRLDNELALALVEINPERWKKHLRKVKGRHVIFVRCSKAIYGTLNAALLSYKKLIGHLEKWDFKMNPYDPCVWNKMVNGKQITCAFHVDDMKVSHYEQSVVDDLVAKLDGIYGKLTQ
jgi:hypothetical protein